MWGLKKNKVLVLANLLKVIYKGGKKQKNFSINNLLFSVCNLPLLILNVCL